MIGTLLCIWHAFISFNIPSKSMREVLLLFPIYLSDQIGSFLMEPGNINFFNTHKIFKSIVSFHSKNINLGIWCYVKGGGGDEQE